MRRGFRLAAVLRLRTAQVDEAARVLAAARLAERAAQSAIDSMLAEVRSCTPEQRESAQQAFFAAQRREGLRERIGSTRRQLEQLRQRSLEAIGVWQTARARLHAVEVLHERFRRAERLELARLEQRETDELAMIRHRSRSRTTEAGPQGLQNDPNMSPGKVRP
ncbi:MAG: flagellar export protein FliJ [Actinomycetota bacterium]|nr:flagellar export protein FliJ [Actinomycetota bacterium]